jgi:hypothetical protein
MAEDADQPQRPDARHLDGIDRAMERSPESPPAGGIHVCE